MADCFGCDKYVECDSVKVARCFAEGCVCKDYVELRVESKKTTRICKYCGVEYSNRPNKSMCNRCAEMSPLLPRFRKARDDIREWCGLERMGDA